jgi:hypothetical protein
MNCRLFNGTTVEVNNSEEARQVKLNYLVNRPIYKIGEDRLIEITSELGVYCTPEGIFRIAKKSDTISRIRFGQVKRVLVFDTEKWLIGGIINEVDTGSGEYPSIYPTGLSSRASVRTHDLMAVAYEIYNKDNYTKYINHMDSTKDCNLMNLEVVSHQDNIKHMRLNIVLREFIREKYHLNSLVRFSALKCSNIESKLDDYITWIGLIVKDIHENDNVSHYQFNDLTVTLFR